MQEERNLEDKAPHLDPTSQDRMEVMMRLLEEEEIDAWSAEEEKEVDTGGSYAADLASKMVRGTDEPERAE
jgi:hypothetical protein